MCGHSNMFGCLHMFGCPHVCLEYVWMPAVHIQYKKACFVRQRGCPYSWHTFGFAKCLSVPHTFGCHRTFGSIQTYSGAAKHMEGIQTYRGCPNVWGIQPDRGVSKHRGHPNIWGECKHWGCPNIQVGIQTYGGCPNLWKHPNIQGSIQTFGASKHKMGASKHMEASKCMGAYSHPLSLTKHSLFVLCIYRDHPNIIQTYGGHLNI